MFGIFNKMLQLVGHINALSVKINDNLKIQLVPRSKHTPSQLYKPVS
jgi:hypothetical protein